MKTVLAVLTITCAAMGLQAQTNANHYVPNKSDMRIVDGKMYNRVLSTNWATLPQPGATLEVVEVVTNGVVLQSRMDGKAGQKLLVKNYPAAKTLTKGNVIMTPFRALEVGEVKYGGGMVTTYDCGLADTKENRKTLKVGPIHAAQ
jgi:hypothetical protein